MERLKPSSTPSSTSMISLSQCDDTTYNINFNNIKQPPKFQQNHKIQKSNQEEEEEEDEDRSAGNKSPDPPQLKSKRGRKKKRKLKSVVEEEEHQNPVGFGSDVLLKGRPTSRRSMAGMLSGSPDSLEDDGRSNFDKKDKQAQTQKVARLVSGKLPEQQFATPIPARKILELTLDKLQKKDKYEVFAEPVDPEEVPDYYDYIKNPMDFSTIRKKLAKGIYASLEQFEKDVFLICSNAMSYNASSTIYYRHARAIQELAKKYFEMLRLDPESIELEHKSPPRSKTVYPTNKFTNGSPSEKSPLESAGSEFASGATPASNGSNANSLNTSLHDLVKVKKGDASERSGIAYAYSNGTGIQGHHSTDGNSSAVENKANQLETFAVSALKVRSVKDGRRALSWEEERRETYRPRNIFANGDESMFGNLGGESKQLVPIGIQSECMYAKSLARFSADLGPMARKIAAQKIKRAWTAVVASFPQHNGDLRATSHLPSIEKNKSQPKPQTSVSLHTNNNDNRFNHILANQLDRNEGFVRKGTSEGQLNQLTSTVNLARNSNVYHQSANCSSSSNPQLVQLNSLQELSTELPFEGTKQIDKKSAELIATGAKFPTEVSQSRLLEMVSRNNRLMQWMPTKQADGRQPGMNFRVMDSGSAVIDRGGGPRETFDTSKLPTSSGSTIVAGSTGNTSINDYQVRSLAVSGGRNASENFTVKDFNHLATSDKSNMFLPLQQTAPNRSVSNSQMSVSSAGPIMTEEHNSIQPCGQSQTADMAQLDCSPKRTHSTVPIASSTHLNLQQQEPQVRPSSSISQLMQQKMLLGMSSYLQSQLSRMNPQNSSILVQNISDGHTGKIFESHISNRVVPSTNGKSLGGNESPQPHLNPLKGVYPQEHFHKISDLSHSVPSDMNIGFQSPKSPVRQSSETSSHSQQPDLALQL